MKPFVSFFYDPLFEVTETMPGKFGRADVKAVYEKFLETYDPADDSGAWFAKIQKIGEALGYTPDMKAYKADPDAYKGNVGDVSMFLRIAVTGRMNSPDMYAVMQILGEDRVRARIEAALKAL